MFPRVKGVLIAAEKGGIEAVKLYFNQPDMEVDPNTWCGNIKNAIEEGHTISVLTEIELIKEKFNFYKYVSEERSDPSAG